MQDLIQKKRVKDNQWNRNKTSTRDNLWYEWSPVSLLKGREKTLPAVDISLPEKYPDGHVIKRKKIEDLVESDSLYS